MLHPVPRIDGCPLFCGPTAICAVTGLDAITVLAAVHRFTGQSIRKPITGMSYAEVIGSLALLGWRCERYEIRNYKPTFLRFLRYEMNARFNPCIIELWQHYCSISEDEYVCNQTNGEVVPLFAAPNMRVRVRSILEVQKI